MTVAKAAVKEKASGQYVNTRAGPSQHTSPAALDSLPSNRSQFWEHMQEQVISPSGERSPTGSKASHWAPPFQGPPPCPDLQETNHSSDTLMNEQDIRYQDTLGHGNGGTVYKDASLEQNRVWVLLVAVLTGPGAVPYLHKALSVWGTTLQKQPSRSKRGTKCCPLQGDSEL
ncbi:Dual specificity mitogen-activated protein kinase kinase 5 [Fukomys damarensis]|uniref:Dual specificity mitogen-activated protein kinase kinase 5 n=1 Tax=Fukomys damarensis TaxID=885580 RepID=A0A091D4J1_FUKDA|nr:Dual specificity mitogen-activated protein kinase kinase 5 [Fukomys damarensis]